MKKSRYGKVLIACTLLYSSAQAIAKYTHIYTYNSDDEKVD